MKLNFIFLDKKKFNEYKNDINDSEKEHHENTRTTIQDYNEIVSNDLNMSFVALLEDKYVGNIISCGLDDDEYQNYKIPKEIKTLYVYNIVVNKQYQGKGFGKELFKKLIESAKDDDYLKLIGHFRKNESWHIIKKFGGEEVSTVSNWENTGEDFVFGVLNL